MSITVALKAGICVPPTDRVRIGTRRGLVYLGLGAKTLEMRTPVAHRTGFDMVKLAGDAMPTDFIVLSVNGESLDLPSESATRIGAALLRKADDADDYQLRMGT